MKITEIIKQIAEHKAVIKEHTDECKELTDSLRDTMVEKNTQEYVLPNVGKVTLNPYYKWKYPTTIETMEAQLKEAKKESEQRGEATNEITHYVKFYPQRD